MSRQIDLKQKLSKADVEYLESRGNTDALARNKAYLEGAEFEAAPTGLPDTSDQTGGGSGAAVTPPPAPPAPPSEDESDGVSEYDALTNEELQVILKSRELTVSGTKAELVARLVENDSTAK